MFAVFRIANYQGRPSPDRRPRNSQPHCQRSFFPYTTNPNFNNHRLQRIGSPGQRRTPTPLMDPVPPFSGMRKLADSPFASTRNLRTFYIFQTVAVRLRKKLISTIIPLLVYSWLPLVDYVLQIRRRRMISVRSRRRSNFNRAKFFHRLLRANVVLPDEEHNALNKLKRVI